MKRIKNWLPSSSLSFIIYYLLVITIISIPRLNSYYFKSNLIFPDRIPISTVWKTLYYLKVKHTKKKIDTFAGGKEKKKPT